MSQETYKGNLVFEQIALQTVLRNELSSKTEVPLYNEMQCNIINTLSINCNMTDPGERQNYKIWIMWSEQRTSTVEKIFWDKGIQICILEIQCYTWLAYMLANILDRYEIYN